MNERVSIKEGGLTRELSPIDKVKVNNTDETQSIWVSKDDMNTGTLYATENGIYIASEDGYDAYDEVLIRVTDESYDGGNKWKDVDPDEDRYTWDDKTYQDYKTDPNSFDDKFNDPTKWKDEDLGDNLDYKYNDGNSISGIDPETGGKVEYSVDEDGFLDEEYIPWAIEITRLPDRTEFYDGHRIVFSGIEVSALTTNADGGDTYTPIPYNELIFPVTIARCDNFTEECTSELGTFPICSSFDIGEPVVGKAGWSARSGLGLFYYEEGGGELIKSVLPSKTQGAIVGVRTYYNMGIDGPIVEPQTLTADIEYTYNDKTVYFYSSSWGLTMGGTDDIPRIPPINTYQAAWTMIYGEKKKLSGTMTVPVQWISPDGFALEDSYTITVFPDHSGGGEDGGSEGGDTVDQDGRFSWNGKNYKLNDSLAAEVHYANGNVWIEGISTDYTVGQAVDLNLVIPV